MLLICTTCDGLGQERRKITHPLANTHGWTREAPVVQKIGHFNCGVLSPWWRRTCKTCNGDGFIESGGTSVPTVPKR